MSDFEREFCELRAMVAELSPMCSRNRPRPRIDRIIDEITRVEELVHDHLARIRRECRPAGASTSGAGVVVQGLAPLATDVGPDGAVCVDGHAACLPTDSGYVLAK